MKFRLLFAALPLLVALAAPSPAQLPSQSTITGPLVRGPDGEVEVAPDAAPSAATPGGRPRRAAPSARGTTITRQIANAPGWQPRSTYAAGTNFTASRVLAGPGWRAEPPEGFTNGAPVYLWIATNAGVSAAGGNGPQSCPAPGSSTVTESTGLTWKCLSVIDYDTITGFLFDDDDWQPHTPYRFNEYAVADNPPRVYRITPNQLKGCTSGAASPKGAGSAISDGGCTWQSVTSLGYSSQASHIPKQSYIPGKGAVIGMENYYVGNIWYGGPARPEYIPGQNGETDPIMPMAHADFTTDDSAEENTPVCAGAAPGYPNCGAAGTLYPTSYTKDYRITLMAQATDSFVGNPDAATTRLAYDPTHGVAIHAVSPPHTTGFSGHQRGGDAINIYDSSVNLYGLQIKADHGAGIDGSPRGNLVTVQNVIVDAPGWCPGSDCINSGTNAAVFLDSVGTILDSLIIMRGSLPGAMGVAFSYHGYMVNDTVVNLGASPDSTCMLHGNIIFGAPLFQNVYCAGFVHQAATRVGGISTLAADIDATTTSLTTNSPCCFDDPELSVDREDMRLTSDDNRGLGATRLTVQRGVHGTTAAPHKKGAIIAGAFDQSQSRHNAVSNAPQTVVTVIGGRIGSSNFPGVGADCGPSHESSCYGLSAADEFVNPTGDFRLKPTAALIGAGIASSVDNGIFNTPFVNSSGIVGAARPQTASHDIGAWTAPRP